MDLRTLEITVISAKDIKDVNLISKMDVYVVVSINGDSRSKQKTPIDRDGGTCPTWNTLMKFTLDESAAQQNRLTLSFKLRCERAFGDKDIGEVNVPIKELLNSAGASNTTQFVTYQVRKPSGKPKGELNLSYKFGEKAVSPSAPEAPAAVMAYPPAASVTPKADAPVTAYPAAVAASSSVYPPVAAYPPAPAGYGYPPPPPPGYGYTPAPAQAGYGYPPQPGYGYPPQPGYGYPPAVQQPKKKSKFGLGLGAGLLGGVLGGMLVGDLVSDAAAYDAGYDGGFDDGGGFGDF